MKWRALLLVVVAGVMALLALVSLTTTAAGYTCGTPARLAFRDITPEVPPGSVLVCMEYCPKDVVKCQRDDRVQLGGALVLGAAAATWFVVGRRRRARPADVLPKQMEHTSA